VRGRAGREGAGGVSAAALSDGSLLSLRELSVVPEGEEFVVGDAVTGVYVLLPKLGVRALGLLSSGCTVGEAWRALDGDVDVADFAESLIELGFAAVRDGDDGSDGVPSPVGLPAPRWLRGLFSRPAWIVYGACALGSVVALAVRPGLFPHASDMFFLDTPARSLAALTAITYVLAAAHELSHWLAARAVGVRSRITLARRLYFLVLEIDLTGLWGLPRRRRYSALLAGMAFDAVVLLPLLTARLGGELGWWRLGDRADRTLAALAFVEVTAIMAQFWIFVRTDVYAVLITATGCVNLFHVNQLMLRRALRRATPDQQEELARAHPRDVAVARWFRWVYAAGLAAATGFFVAYFVPATARLVAWTVRSVAHAGAGSERFWEALVFGTLILSPTALTAAVVLRDLRGALVRRAALARGRGRGLRSQDVG
jgi:hypothetical protein